MEKLNLTVKTRDLDKDRPNKVRSEGMLPMVLYGNKQPNEHLLSDYIQFEKIYRAAGSNTIIEIAIGDKAKENVLIYSVDYEPITGRIQHVDLLRVNMSEKITTKVPLEFVGLSKAVKELAGIFIANIDELQVTCLPNDLPKDIKVDISVLNTFDDAIHAKELVLPSGIEIELDPEEVIAVVVPPRSEEELASLDQEVNEDLEKVEVSEKGKEKEEGADGKEEKAEKK